MTYQIAFSALRRLCKHRGLRPRNYGRQNSYPICYYKVRKPGKKLICRTDRCPLIVKKGNKLEIKVEKD